MRYYHLCVTVLFAGTTFAQTQPVREAKPVADFKETTGNASLPVRKVARWARWARCSVWRR
jgi:hypothetical protein